MLQVTYCAFCRPSDAKRLIGRRFDDAVVQSDMKHWPFTVINEGSRPKVRVEYKGETKSFYPEEISSMVLIKMKEIAEAYLGKVHFILCLSRVDRYCCLNRLGIYELCFNLTTVYLMLNKCH